MGVGGSPTTNTAGHSATNKMASCGSANPGLRAQRNPSGLRRIFFCFETRVCPIACQRMNVFVKPLPELSRPQPESTNAYVLVALLRQPPYRSRCQYGQASRIFRRSHICPCRILSFPTSHSLRARGFSKSPPLSHFFLKKSATK